MIFYKLKTIRYWLIFSCLVALFGAQVPWLMSGIVGAHSSAPLPTATVEPAPFNTLCIPGSLDGTGPNTDLTFNRPGSTLPIPPCSLTGAFTLYDAYAFTVTGCANPTITVSTCTGPCGTQSTLDTLLFVYQKAGGAPTGPGGTSPIFAPANPCTNLFTANNNFCSPASQITTPIQTTANTGDFVVVVTANSPFSAVNTATFGPYNLRVDAPGCTVVQQPQPCFYSLSPTEQTFGAAGGSSSVMVTTGTGCAWTAASNDAFITVDSGSPGLGSGSVGYTVAANPGSARIGTLTIAGQTFTVTQEAGAVAVPCIMDALVAGPTFYRPSAGPITCPTSPVAVTPQNPQGFTNPAVYYKAYELTLSGCASGILTASTCGTTPCSTGPGTLADTVLFIYRKPDGSPSSMGSPIFNPSTPCTNAIAANNNSCGSLSQVSTVLSAGSFVVVVTSNGANQTGTFNLSVTAPGCTLAAPCTITCPANVTASNDPNQCGAVVNYPAPSGSCGTVTCSPQSGAFFPVGTTTVNCTSTGGASCSFTVTVNDTQAPTITCPANVTQANDPNLCSAVVTYLAPTVSDNCPGVGSPICNPPSGSAFPKGNTTVTCSVSDASGNTGSCSFSVTVNDTQPPTITCPANVTQANDPGQCSAAVTYTTPTPGDNCPGATASCVPASGSTFPKGTTTVTCTATDTSGNTATCTFTVTVNDTQAPTVTCPANVTQANDPNQCSAAVTYTTPTASDNCSGATVACLPASGSTFPKGATTVTCTATDASGNTATCTFTVTVNDTQPPAVTCPANVVAGTAPNQCVGVVSYATPTASDNCSGATVTCAPPSGSAFPKGTTPVTCTATDTSGNTATCSFNVTVNDTQPPTIICPANVSANNAPGFCSAAVAYPPPAFSDNCPGASAVCVPASGATFPVGTTNVICTATDTSGNTATCSFMVTVVDVQPPIITTCPPDRTLSTNGGNQVALPNLTGEVVASDNCTPSGSLVITQSPVAGTMVGVGATTVTITVKDAANNQATCTVTVTVYRYLIKDFVAFSSESTKLLTNVSVHTGNVGANTSLPDPNGPPDDKVEVELGVNAKMLQSGSSVVGDTVKLDVNSQVYNVYYNESQFSPLAHILGNQVTPQPLPVSPMPAFPTVTPGTTDVTVGINQTQTLGPGSYRNITVQTNGKLILSGGLYQVASLSIGTNAKVLFLAASEVRIKTWMAADVSNVIGPDASVPSLQASQIVFYVEGTDSLLSVVQIGVNSTLKANIYAPNGTVWLKASTNATGAFIGKQTRIDTSVQLTLKSAF